MEYIKSMMNIKSMNLLDFLKEKEIDIENMDESLYKNISYLRSISSKKSLEWTQYELFIIMKFIGEYETLNYITYLIYDFNEYFKSCDNYRSLLNCCPYTMNNIEKYSISLGKYIAYERLKLMDILDKYLKNDVKKKLKYMYDEIINLSIDKGLNHEQKLSKINKKIYDMISLIPHHLIGVSPDIFGYFYYISEKKE